MVGYITHFTVGMVLAFPIVKLDTKDKYKTLIIGGVAGVFPDIDQIIAQIPLGVEHRGGVHSFELWMVLTMLSWIVALTYISIKEVNKESIAYDIGLYVAAISLGWLGHLIADFGFTDYQNQRGWWMSIREQNPPELWILDNITGFIASAILGGLLWIKIDEVSRLEAGEKSPDEVSERSIDRTDQCSIGRIISKFKSILPTDASKFQTWGAIIGGLGFFSVLVLVVFKFIINVSHPFLGRPILILSFIFGFLSLLFLIRKKWDVGFGTMKQDTSIIVILMWILLVTIVVLLLIE